MQQSKDSILRNTFDGDGLTEEVVGERRSVRRLRSGTMVVLLMAGVAIVGLFSMRNIGRVSASAGISGEIEALVASVLPSQLGITAGDGTEPKPEVDESALFSMLDTDFRADLQVPFSEIGRDPFEPWRDPNRVAAPATPFAVDARSSARDAWAEEIERIAQMLQLKSLIGGGSPHAMANINGRILRPGDRFTVTEAEADFSILAIERDSVRLRARHPRLGIEREVEIKVPRPF